MHTYALTHAYACSYLYANVAIYEVTARGIHLRACPLAHTHMLIHTVTETWRQCNTAVGTKWALPASWHTGAPTRQKQRMKSTFTIRLLTPKTSGTLQSGRERLGGGKEGTLRSGGSMETDKLGSTVWVYMWEIRIRTRDLGARCLFVESDYGHGSAFRSAKKARPSVHVSRAGNVRGACIGWLRTWYLVWEAVLWPRCDYLDANNSARAERSSNKARQRWRVKSNLNDSLNVFTHIYVKSYTYICVWCHVHIFIWCHHTHSCMYACM